MAKNIYEILGVSNDASTEEIRNAHSEKMAQLIAQKQNNDITEEEFNAKAKELNDAYAILCDKEKRLEYDNALRMMSCTGASVGTPNGNKKTNSIIKKIGLGLGAVALVAGIAVAGWMIKDKIDEKSNTNSQPEIVINIGNPTPEPDSSKNPSESEEPDSSEEPSESETPEETEPVIDSSIPEVVNYGDAKDDALLTERATKLLDELNTNGLYNLGTDKPFTIEEIKNIIQYMNGAYKPVNEDEAYTFVNEFLNFAIAPGNSDQVVAAVNYQGGNDNLKSIIEESSKTKTRLNIVDNMLFGNSATYPYLKWLEDQYNIMICTTDREECRKTYDSIIQSLADMTYGNGYTLDGKVYKLNDFLGLDKVNSGNILQLFVYMTGPFRTATTADEFTVRGRFADVDPESENIIVGYDTIMEQFNILCDESLPEFTVGDDGLIVINRTDGENFFNVNQVNTINRALMEYYGKGLAYENVYQKKLN